MNENESLDLILGDLSEHAKKVMRNNKVKFSDSENEEEILLAYLNTSKKKISAQPRQVNISKELKKKIDTNTLSNSSNENYDIKDLIFHFKNLFEEGANVNFNLSSKIFSSQKQDILFNTWNIKHIHLNKNEVKSKTGMRRNRSDFLLFFIVEENEVFFVDVRKHPKHDEFSSYEFLTIAFQNDWMNKLGFTEMTSDYLPGSLEPKVSNDEDLYKLYSLGLNIAFDFNGRGFISVLSGITSSQHKIEIVREFRQLKRDLIQVTQGNKYIAFIPNNENELSGILQFEEETNNCQVEFPKL